MTSVLEKHLPSILESIAAELRMNADSKYKCSLLKDTKLKGMFVIEMINDILQNNYVHKISY